MTVRASMPPPENLMLGEALADVAQGTAAIMQLLQNQGGQRGDRPQHTTLQQFLATSPPRFAEARDPLEAADWLAKIKKHLTANQSGQWTMSRSRPSSSRVQQAVGTRPTRTTRAMV